MCDLRDYPLVLAGHPSARRVLARAAELAVSSADTTLDRHVGCSGRDYLAVAKCDALQQRMDLDPGSIPLRHWFVDLQGFWKRIQRSPTRRFSRGHARAPRTAAIDVGHPRSRSPSRLPGTSVRDAGVERWHRIDRLLWLDHACRDLG